MKGDKMMEKLPEGWKKVRLGKVIQYKQPTKYIVKSEKYDEQTGIPVLTAGKSFILGYTDEEGVFTDVPVIIFDDFTTESKWVNFPFKVKSSALKILKVRNSENNLYFFYNLMQILNFKPGSEHKRFWISEYSKLTVSVPPLPEQRKIAEILETVDNAIEKTDKIIEKYKRIKQGLMQDLLTKGIVENYELGIRNYELRNEKRHKFKDSPLGRIPEEWEAVRLGEVLVYEQPWKYAVKSEKYDQSHGTPVLTAGKSFILGYTEEKDGIFTKLPAIIFDDFTTESRFVNFPFKVKSSALKILKTRDNSFDIFFLFNILQTIRLKPGSEHKRFWISEYSKLSVFIPPLPEQHRIASILSQIDETIEKEQKYKEKLEKIKRGLMEDLLTGKVRVN